MTHDEYKQKTIAMIRECDGRLSSKTDDELACLYREWSSVTASAGWLLHSDRGIKAFYEWATVAPCDR